MTPNKATPKASVPRQKLDRSDPQYIMYKSLPFKKRKMGFADWIYKNKLGVSALVIIFLTLFFAFVSVRIDLTQIILNPGFYMETPIEEEEVVEEPEEEKLPDILEEQMYEEIKNVTVNRGAKLDAGLKDDKGTNANDIYKEAQAMQDRLDANKAANAKSMSELNNVDNLVSTREKLKGESEDKSEQSNIKGKVTVSYELDGRRASYLPIPAYKCEGGGEVVVSVVVNDNGDVISAEVDKTTSTRNTCVNETAVDFAKRSRFELNGRWSSKHKGTITYIFLNQ